MKFFLTQFIVSAKTTETYLRDAVLKRKDRILFAVYVDGDLVGHCGLKNITLTSAEADNIMRGKSGGQKDLMYFVERALLVWAFNRLKIEVVSAEILSKNFLSTALFKRLGFSLVKRCPLKKIQKDGLVSYEQCRMDESTELFFLDILHINRRDFLKRVI